MQAGEVHVVPGCSAGGVRVLLAVPSPPSSAPITGLSAFLLRAGCGRGSKPSWRDAARYETSLVVRTCRSGCSLMPAGIWLLGSFHRIIE